jgi:hypothetical protein
MRAPDERGDGPAIAPLREPSYGWPVGPTTEGQASRLGIPEDARWVLIVGESSHWDPDWLLTANEYYRLRIRRILDRALWVLAREPHRVYSLESVFFLKMYWDRNPARQQELRRLINEGRLRLTGSGVTTPDTLLPGTEAIIRDFLYGQQWLRDHGMTQEPTVAYLPDNFGNTPALPTLLRELGFTATAFARLDGAHFPGCDLRPARDFPLPGSSAHRLLRDEQSLDFVWRDAAGAEVLARFHAFGYSQGDLLAHRGLTRWMGLPLAVRDRSEGHVARRIDQLVQQIRPYARTRYLFCPIGFDFVSPLAVLTPLLERYNRRRYPQTGIYAVNAGLDDYFALVAEHREALPVVQLDPNPYWTGFYASRPSHKRRCRRLAQTLVEVEQRALAADPSARPPLEDAWFWATVSNHHDFITGTVPDRVYRLEQKPRVEEALRHADSLAWRLARGGAAESASPPPSPASALPTWRRTGGILVVETDDYVIEIDAGRGGCIRRMADARTGEEWLAPSSADLIMLHDTGGLWRMGHEYRGGSLREIARASSGSAAVRASECNGTLEVRTHCTVAGDALVRTLWLSAATPVVRLRVEGRLSPHRTLLCRLGSPRPLADRAWMDVPGGVTERASRKLFDPTFWCAHRFVHVPAQHLGASGLALLLASSTGVTFDPAGTMDFVALRHAPQERAHGYIPMPAFPARGTERELTTFDCAFTFPRGADAVRPGLQRLAHTAFDDGWDTSRRPPAPRPVQLSDEGAQVLAVKPASHGEGVVVRIERDAVNDGAVGTRRSLRLRWHDRPILRAVRCDGRERDLDALHVEDGWAVVPRGHDLVSVRLFLEGTTG